MKNLKGGFTAEVFNEAQKLVDKNIVPKFEAKRMSIDIK